ncbi:hypothetical protein MP638_004034 [Amoeboaphelidium occidentale]|nr:hypothetical protein MP638_004034 [Amoeboaphelidium occidentale]
MKTILALQILLALACFNSYANAARVYLTTYGRLTTELHVTFCDDNSKEGRKSSFVSMRIEKDVEATRVNKYRDGIGAFFSLMAGLTIKVPFTCGVSAFEAPQKAYKKIRRSASIFDFIMEARASNENGTASEITDRAYDNYYTAGKNPFVGRFLGLRDFEVVFDFSEELNNNMTISKLVLALEKRYGFFVIDWSILKDGYDFFRKHPDDKFPVLENYKFKPLGGDIEDIAEFASKESPIVVLRALLTYKKGQDGSKKFRPKSLLSAAISADPIKVTEDEGKD